MQSLLASDEAQRELRERLSDGSGPAFGLRHGVQDRGIATLRYPSERLQGEHVGFFRFQFEELPAGVLWRTRITTEANVGDTDHLAPVLHLRHHLLVKRGGEVKGFLDGTGNGASHAHASVQQQATAFFCRCGFGFHYCPTYFYALIKLCFKLLLAPTTLPRFREERVFFVFVGHGLLPTVIV